MQILERVNQSFDGGDNSFLADFNQKLKIDFMNPQIML